MKMAGERRSPERQRWRRRLAPKHVRRGRDAAAVFPIPEKNREKDEGDGGGVPSSTTWSGGERGAAAGSCTIAVETGDGR
jgi:hypothetical protein